MIHFEDINKYQFQNKSIYIINVDLVQNRTQVYVKETFEIAFKILNSRLTNKFINGPVNKSKFLNKKFLGITEYISKKFKQDKVAMLIYNKELSVCPITTHLPLKLVSKKLNQKLIKEKVTLINNFYIKEMGFKPKLAITGLNPHCESFLKENEDSKIIKPAIKNLRNRGYNVYGPFQLTEGGYTTLIGRWINNINKNIPCEIYGDGEQRRDFTHVDDIVEGLILIMEKESYGHEFELGRGKNTSVNKVAKMFNINPTYKDSKPGEARHTLCKSKLAKQLLNWNPQIDLVDYIKDLKWKK